MYSKKIVVMLAVRLDEETEGRLDRLGARTGRTKTFYARAAIAAHLDDLEDFYLAEERLRDFRDGDAIPLSTLKAEDGKPLERLNALLKECLRDPFRGTGKPEPLGGNLSGCWSRRINREHRMVYRVTGKGARQALEVAGCWYWYWY